MAAFCSSAFPFPSLKPIFYGPLGRRTVMVSARLNDEPTVLVTERLTSEAALQLLKRSTRVECCYNLTHDDLCSKVGGFDALIVRDKTLVNGDVFRAGGGRLRVVGRSGIEVDNIDIDAATDSGCLVINSPDAVKYYMAEHAFDLLSGFAYNFIDSWETCKYELDRLLGKTLLVIGGDAAGALFAQRAKEAFFMDVTVVHNPYPFLFYPAQADPELETTFEGAIRGADFISLHLPLTPMSSNILNHEIFAKMKKGVRIINISHEGLIDEDALQRAINEGIVADAALDNMKKEPSPSRREVAVTRNLRSPTIQALEGEALGIVGAVLAALKGEIPDTALNANAV